MSLYSKYRPQTFENLVGQDHVRQTLLHEIERSSFAHAYLFTGPRGTGKTSTARLIAKALNCSNKLPSGEPCDECELCVGIKEGNLIDVVEIDAASNRGIDEIRDLKEKIQFAPTRAPTKTYIIDEVHMLTKEAFNALLKTLEEPPEKVYFILCTTEIHKIPETIISRCQRFDFKRISIESIVSRLKAIAKNEKIKTNDEALELIARHVEGGLRDAIGLLEQLTVHGELKSNEVRTHLSITGHQTINTLLDTLREKNTAEALKIINAVHNEGYDLTTFVREVLDCLREHMLKDIHGGKANAGHYLHMIEYFEEARDMLRNTLIPQLPLEVAVIKICMPVEKLIVEQSAQKSEPVRAAVKEPDEIKEIKVNPEATKEEEATATTLKKNYELEDGELLKHWPRILEHIQPPSLQRSLSTGKPKQIDSTHIVVLFSARFHSEKVNTAEGRSKIEQAIMHLFGTKVVVTCDVQAVAAPAEQEAPAKEISRRRETPPAAKAKGDLASKAMEIFGSDEF